MSVPDISAVITFHREGVLAHATLRSYGKSRQWARAAGISIQFILVLDNADEVTRHTVTGHPDLDGTEVLLDLAVGDCAEARNAGIAKSFGKYICTLDGDDLISADYFTKHKLQADGMGSNVVLHPEMVVSFGMYSSFNWQVDQGGDYYDRNGLLTVNPWVSAGFARREVYLSIPYAACRPAQTGFGYEDWYWNCETIAQGVEHRLAWGTAYFYRRKLRGSLNESSNSRSTLVPRTALFDQPVMEAC